MAKSASTLVLLLTTLGCGGGSGITNALSLGDEDQPINGISVNPDDAQKIADNAGDPAKGKEAVTAAAFTQCPDGEMTPADMSKLSCLVGRYQGVRSDPNANSISPPGEKCYMSLQADGRMTLQIPGVFEHQHQFSHRPVTAAATKGSHYQYSNRGNVNATTEETTPWIALQSRFPGAGSIKVVDDYSMALMMVSVGPGSTLFAWQVDSIINDQVEQCGGQLAVPSTTPSGSSPSAQPAR